jgi:hypothetical protein
VDRAEAFEYLQQVRLRHPGPPASRRRSRTTWCRWRRWLRDLFRLLDIARQSVRLHLQSDLRG